MNLYDRINELAKERGLSVCGLCKKAKVATSSIYELKSDKKVDINRKTAEKLATALDISVDELYGKEKAPDAEAPEAEYQEVINLLNQLPEDKRQNALDYLKFLASNNQ